MLLYRHRTLDTKEVFYIGIGSRKRSIDKNRRSLFWKNIVNKHGYTIEILANNLSVEDAFELEIFLISLYGRRDNNTGILVNLTDGSEGSFKVIVSEERKEKMRIINTGKKLTDEHKKKIGIANKGKKFPLLDRTKQKEKVSKKVINIDTKIIYNSAKEVALLLNMKYINLTRQLNGHNKNKTKFKYYDELYNSQCNIK